MGDLSEQLAEIFPNFKDFQNHGRQRIGVHDNADGTQWSYYYDLGSKRHYLVVNLEGKKYGAQDWPIALFLEQELSSPKLHALLESLPSVDGVELIWMRDNWVSRRYREPVDDFLADTPTPLSLVTQEVWPKSLSEARNCLSPDKNGRGRGTRIVRQPGGERSVRWTTPHLQFRLLLPLPLESRGLNSRERDEAVRLMFCEGFKKLQPLYDFVAERSAA
jgi:hypothetical protein